MDIEVICDVCNSKLHVSPSFAGRNATCPKCHAVIAVPGPFALTGMDEHPLRDIETKRARPSTRPSNDLQATIQRQWIAIGIIGTACVLCLALNLFRRTDNPIAEPTAKSVDSIEAERFIVRNKDGSIAATFGLMSKGQGFQAEGFPGIVLYEKGKPRAEMAVMSHGRVRIVLSDRDEHERASMYVNADPGFEEAQISIRNDKGQDVIAMTSIPINSWLAFFDGQAQTRIQLSVADNETTPRNSPSIIVNDTQGHPKHIIKQLYPKEMSSCLH